jgi:DNA-binding GntR family transcriptional regulator
VNNVPISRSVLSDQVKDHLLQEIMTGSYPPGSRIVETRVARELGTSQAPVREALRDLEALGVVEITAFHGARVRHPGKAELLEAYGVRAELESLGARLALSRMSDADLEELQSLVDQMQRAADAHDTHGEALADVRFHARVIEISGNHTLERVWRFLEPGSRTYITLVVPGVNSRQVADLHVPILDALRHRDPELAVAAYHRHFEAVGEMFRARWVDEPSEEASIASNPDTAFPDVGPTRQSKAALDGVASSLEPPDGGRPTRPVTGRTRLADVRQSR